MLKHNRLNRKDFYIAIYLALVLISTKFYLNDIKVLHYNINSNTSGMHVIVTIYLIYFVAGFFLKYCKFWLPIYVIVSQISSQIPWYVSNKLKNTSIKDDVDFLDLKNFILLVSQSLR